MHLTFQGAVPLGAMAGGAVAQAIGIRHTLLAAALGYLLSALWLVFSPVRSLCRLLLGARWAFWYPGRKHCNQTGGRIVNSAFATA